MRKVALMAVCVILLGLALWLYPDNVGKPVKDGSGPLAVVISPQYDAPEYHSPLDFWQTHHMDAVNRGEFTQQDCLYCHVPEQSCNNCHDYVGADRITGEMQPYVQTGAMQPGIWRSLPGVMQPAVGYSAEVKAAWK